MNVEDVKPWLDNVEDYQLSSLYGGTLPRKYIIAVRPSKHGLGLFAAQPIPSGVCVTLYPAHATGKKIGNGQYQMNVVQDIAFRAKQEYMLSTPSGDIICGYPEMVMNDWFLGHMVNDASDINCFRKGREYESAVVYNMMAQRANTKTEWYRGIAMLVTTRAIEANEELVWSYGVNYWFASKGMKDANQRITAYILRQPKERREQMMTLLTNMGDIFKESERLRTSS